MLKDVFIKFLKDLIFPAFCLDCGNEGSFLCVKCFASLEKKITTPKIFVPDKSSLDGIAAVFPYVDRSLPARLIHSFKYDLIKELYIPLGRLLHLYFDDLIETQAFNGEAKDLALCPVPLHKRRLKWRGFNQADLLAIYLGKKTGTQVVYPLKRVHFRSTQMELKREDRLKNIKGAFILREEKGNPREHVSNKSVILIDDVATTLSTLNECALILKSAGCKKVYAIVLARVC